MPTLSVYSVLWSILHCSLMAYVLIVLRRNTSFVMNYGTSPLVLLATCCTMRMLFPFSLIPRTSSSQINKSFFTLYFTSDRSPLFRMCDFAILIIWGIGIIIFIATYIYLYIMARTRIVSNAVPAEAHIDDILHKIDPQCPIKIYVSPDISVPTYAGIFHPNIYITDHPFDNNELYYIILHEYQHWKRADSLKKLAINLITSVMWWNPFIHMMRLEYTRLLELDCDSSLYIHMDQVQRLQYLEALCRAEAFCKKEKPLSESTQSPGPSLSGSSTESHVQESPLKQRATLLVNEYDVEQAIKQGLRDTFSEKPLYKITYYRVKPNESIPLKSNLKRTMPKNIMSEIITSPNLVSTTIIKILLISSILIWFFASYLFPVG